jgi:cell division inhibitor SulA
MDLSYPCIVEAAAAQLRLGKSSPIVGWIDTTSPATVSVQSAAQQSIPEPQSEW